MRTLPARLGLDRPAAQWLLLAASLLVVVLGLRTMIVARRLQQEVRELQAVNRELREREEAGEGRLTDFQPREAEAAKPAEPARSAFFTLSIGLPGGVGPPVRLVVPEGAEIVRLDLNLPARASHERFRVGLRGAPGDEFWSQGRLRPEAGERGPVLRITLPGSALAPGHYELALGGQDLPARVDNLGYYYFQIARP